MPQPVSPATRPAPSVQSTDAHATAVSSSTGLSANHVRLNALLATVHQSALPVSAPGCFRPMPASVLINSIQWLGLPPAILANTHVLLVFPQHSAPAAILP